jgi:hypothetical protein
VDMQRGGHGQWIEPGISGVTIDSAGEGGQGRASLLAARLGKGLAGLVWGGGEAEQSPP